MSRWYLGIDTSNYRTSAALFDAEHCCHENHGRLLDVPQSKLGLRQSEALFQHTIHLHEQIAQLTEGIGTQIRAVCVSTRPRAVEGSYMPCFLAGENVARSIAHILGVPLYICSHQQGHTQLAAYSAAQAFTAGQACVDMASIRWYDRVVACDTGNRWFALCTDHRWHYRYFCGTAHRSSGCALDF